MMRGGWHTRGHESQSNPHLAVSLQGRKVTRIMEIAIDDEPRWQKGFPPSDASSEFFTLKLSPRSCRQLRQNLSTILTIFLRDLHKERMNRVISHYCSDESRAMKGFKSFSSPIFCIPRVSQIAIPNTFSIVTNRTTINQSGAPELENHIILWVRKGMRLPIACKAPFRLVTFD